VTGWVFGEQPKVAEKLCRTALSKTGVSSYDYANFMHRFSGHLQDAWGSFVDVKVNLLDMLGRGLPGWPPGKI
jgi:hypothetical protein